MISARSIAQYGIESIKNDNVWNEGITPNPGTIIEGSSKFVAIGQIGFPSCHIDSYSHTMQEFLTTCDDIRSAYASDITVISKIQLLVSQVLNLFPTDEGYLGRDYENPTREKINTEFYKIQKHHSFFSVLDDTAAPLSEYLKAKTADCRATNLIFAYALKHVGFDVKWSCVQAQRAKVDKQGNLTELEEPEDHAIVLWHAPNQTSLVVLDAYFSEYHGYLFDDLQKGVDRNITKRYSETDGHNFMHAFTLYHGYEKDHGGLTGKPDRIYSDDKNFSGIWKVNNYPRSKVEIKKPILYSF